ncbi:MAG: glycosyltransferase [Eisenbergiella massiliensis]|uniref:glycosyltransferase n=1 Tax=Eisenbergiella massiliensis TaxID=1720294 RepID=UPI003992A7B4
MNQRIAICLNPFISHFIPTITMAKELCSRGNTVQYIGFEDMENVVKKEGFCYLSITSCKNQEIVLLQKRKAYKELGELYRKLHNEVKELLISNGFDLILIGVSRFINYLLPAMKTDAKIVFYSLCAGVPYFQYNTPPVVSDYVMTDKPYDSIVCISRWFARFMRKGLRPNIITSHLFYPWNEIKQECKKRKISWRFGIDGFFPCFPIISFGTKYFEFNDKPNGRFTGLGLSNKECISNNSNSLKLEYDKLSSKPLIYCSLGTMSERYPNAEIFIKAVLSLFMVRPQWNLILSLGKLGKTLEINDLPENIKVIDYAPQLEILKYADIVLTHGGYGTVKECIYYGVPMIVFSCSYDQHGNAARVHYHRIGIKSSILKRSIYQRVFKSFRKKITTDDIDILIQRLLQEEQYKKNILLLRNRIVSTDELNQVINYLVNEVN